MRHTSSGTFGVLLAGLLGCAIVPGMARAAIIFGTFSGTATAASDPTDALGLGADIADDDVITGFFSFDDLQISGGTSVNNLSITVTDVTTGETATFSDPAGSSFNVTDGQYQVTADGSDPNDTIAMLTLAATSILAGDYEQSFTSGPPDGSTGSIGGVNGTLNFAITSADVEVPEPTGLAVVGMGLLTLLALRRRSV